MQIDIRSLGADQQSEFATPILTAFGMTASRERAEQMRRLPELSSRLGAFDGELLAGSAGSYALTMTTPGGAVATAGLTMVAVLPTHRRRGILTELMRQHLAEARSTGQPLGALWATEGTIYGRYGYGLASHACSISIERERAAFAVPAPKTASRVRALGEAESLEVLPAIWERARVTTPGMLSRSPVWWEVRRLDDSERARQGGGPLQRVVIEIEGRPEAYALYRMNARWDSMMLPAGTLQVVEAVGATPLGARLAWRYLLDIDLMERIEAHNLPVDHPLTLLVAEPRRLRLTAADGLWVRLVDVEAALAARAYGGRESITLEIEDRFCPWNTGRFRLDGGERRAVRTTEDPDLRLDAAALGSAYLGGMSFRRLADAGRIEARKEGVLERADTLFRSARAPWCPEVF